MTFDVEYTPVDDGLDTALIRLSGGDVIEIVAVEAVGTHSPVTEAFVVEPAAHDILVHMNWSYGNWGYGEAVRPQLDLLLGELDALDVRLAVVVDDDACIDGTWVTAPDDPHLDEMWCDEPLTTSDRTGCELPDSREQPLGLWLDAIEAECNADFFREDARLELLAVTHERERSQLTSSWYVSSYQAFQPDVRVHALAAEDPPGCGEVEAIRLELAAAETGGLLAPVCEPFATDLATHLLEPRAHTFELAATPLEPPTVTLDGAPVDFTWDDAVTLDVPSTGGTVEVTYTPTPDCDEP